MNINISFQVIPKGNADRLATPTPEPSPKPERFYHSRGRSHRGVRRGSLSTISEEPTQYSSHEIIVQPEVYVETTTLPGSPDTVITPRGSSAGYSMSPPDTPPPPIPSHVTRVKATATVKVEVHTPIPGRFLPL